MLGKREQNILRELDQKGPLTVWDLQVTLDKKEQKNLKEFLDFLEKGGLIEDWGIHWYITPKGRDILK